MSERERSPRRGMCSAVLFLEAITLGLSTPVMIAVADVSPAVALPVGLGLALLSIVASGLLRAEWAYGLGWAIQGAAVVLGFLVTTMFFLGAVFALLWGSADLLGRKIERERAEAYARFDAEQA
ncbi:DUF4233 domain-containing protein [Nocardioides sp.]|uniref:DUF4233 domain-containing protein n=1 Tax=Nocardioides sp. TaxID=35761 RepID=UPI002391FDE3|nr:DUF4233 domain-containing protein [Nocardioides sp.]MDE0774876.1 DUF4233 domain-containing protein [Nocardioides sp.]